MPGKTFRNQTSYDLSITLTPRAGDNPGNDLAPVSFSVRSGGSQYQAYGDDRNPYLDGIALNGAGNGGFIAAQEFAISRGSAIDDGLNKNDHVNISQSGTAFTLGFSNS